MTEIGVPDLQDLAVAYQIAAATERQVRDQNVQKWQSEIAASRDHVHDYLSQVGLGDPKELHKSIEKLEAVIGAMDEFLRRSKK